ncbi:DUF748 domain-containing protein [Aliagarivorans marinus]|uniref:DUF748 domain-containing protein n=1 Tax=Aliagarivorans marinus TaxID=561965 RepID=UPI0003F6B841|nr:DUF748 domain-containing protein [Aliagarivorans marinus]
MTQPASEVNKSKRWAWWKILLLVVVGLFAVYLLLALVAVPTLGRSQAEKQLSAQLGTPARLGSLTFHPFKLSAQLSELELGSAEEPLLSLQAARVELSLSSVLERAWLVTAIELERLHVHVSVDEQGLLNWQKLAPFQAPAESSPNEVEQPADGGLPRFTLSNTRLIDALVDYRDARSGKSLSLDPINLEISELSSYLAAEDQQHRLDMSFSSGGELHWLGRLDLIDSHLQGALSLKQIALSPLVQLVELPVDIQLQQGKLDLDLELDLDFAEEVELKLAGEQLTIADLQLAIEQQPWLSQERLRVSGLAFDLAQQQLSVSSIDSEGLSLWLALDDEQELLPLAKLQPESSAEKPAPEPEPAESAWRWSVEQVAIANAKLRFDEQLSGEPVQHQLLLEALRAGAIDSQLQAFDSQLSLSIASGGRLDFAGLVDPSGQSLALAGEIDQLNLGLLNRYLSPYLEISLQSALFSATPELKLSWAEPLSYQLAGGYQLGQLKIIDQRDQSELLAWDRLDVPSLEVDSQTRLIRIASSQLDAPAMQIEIRPDFSTNLQGLVKPTSSPSDSSANDEQPASQGEDSEPAPWTIELAGLSLKDGQVDFADYTLEPNFQTDIQRVNGQLGALSNHPDSSAELQLSGQVDGYAPVAFQGSAAPFAEQLQFDSALSFEHLELTRLNAYSGTYAGYVIERGQLSLDLGYQVEQGQLNGDNRIVIEQLKLGKRIQSEKATSLPLELAVALLEDDQGVIDLGLQVNGDINDPSFDVSALIGKAIGSAITKLITSPFSIIASLVGTDDNLSQVSFAPGSSELTAAQSQRIASLAKGIQQRPSVKLGLQGYVDPVGEAEAIKQQLLSEQLLSGQQLSDQQQSAGESDAAVALIGLDEILVEPSLQTALEQAYLEAIPAEQATEAYQQLRQQLQAEDRLAALDEELLGLRYQTLMDIQQVDEQRYKALAEARADAVKQALLEQGIELERVFVERVDRQSAQGEPSVELSILAN